MNRILKILTWLRITDKHDGLLSLTNLAVLVTLIKVAITPAASLTEVGTLFIAIAGYAYKKHINKDAAEPDAITLEVEEMKAKLETVESTITAISIQAGIRRT